MKTDTHITSFDASHVPFLRTALNDRALMGIASRAQVLGGSLAHRTTIRNLIAEACVEAARTGFDVGAILAAQVAELEAAITALPVSDRIVDAALVADGQSRNALDAACGARAEYVARAITGLQGQIISLPIVAGEKRASLNGLGMSQAECARILGEHADPAPKIAEMRLQVAAFKQEAAVLMEYLRDPLRDRARLGALLPVVEAVNGRGISDYTLLADWSARGPVDLCEVA